MDQAVLSLAQPRTGARGPLLNQGNRFRVTAASLFATTSQAAMAVH